MFLIALALALSQSGDCLDPAACAPSIGYEEEATAPAAPFDGDVLPMLETAAAAMSANHSEYHGADLYAELGETRRKELRCATVALFATEAGKGRDLTRSLGLTSEASEVLAGTLTEALIDETGKDAGEVRALFSTDLSAFTEEVRPAVDPAAAVVAALGECRPLYDTIVVNDGPDGYVTGLAPTEVLVDPAYPNPVACFALLSAFAEAMTPKSEGRKSLSDGVQRIRSAWLANPDAGSSAEHDLTMAAINFDREAFSALPEAKAEDRIIYCMRLGGIQ